MRPDAVVSIGPEWNDPGTDLLEIDRRVHAYEGQPFVLQLAVAHPEQVLLRYQRIWPFRNGASDTDAFRTFERQHAELHDCSLPLVRADFDHARDTWQWVLRLDADASLEVQLAALLHDVERLESEPLVRIEQHAPDYVAFKQAHARRGAALARQILAGRFDDAVADRVGHLVSDHEQGDDGELALLRDADALSWFSLNCAGYLRWYGAEQTERKVAYTLARLSPRARPWLARMRLPDPVDRAVFSQRR
jgi:hypothetical protein